MLTVPPNVAPLHCIYQFLDRHGFILLPSFLPYREMKARPSRSQASLTVLLCSINQHPAKTLAHMLLVDLGGRNWLGHSGLSLKVRRCSKLQGGRDREEITSSERRRTVGEKEKRKQEEGGKKNCGAPAMQDCSKNANKNCKR